MAKDDRYYMKMALDIAKQGIGLTKTNPRVGAVIVKDNRVIGSGYHRGFNSPHAEIDAISNATEDVRGATLYCNLEPCSCYYPGKKSPPCTFEIIKRKIARVVICNIDTNPQFLGAGIKKLQDSGIKVDCGILKESGYVLNEGFFKYINQKKPFIHIKYASTLDGKLSTLSGDSKWITSDKSRQEAHYMRSLSDCIMVGNRTVINDNPNLNIRLKDYKGDEIKKIVVCSDLSNFPSNSILAKKYPDSTIIMTNNIENKNYEILKQLGITVIKVKQNESGFVDLQDVVDNIYSLNLMKVLVEGGKTLITNLLKLGLYDKVSVFIAPKLIGGNMSIGDIGIDSMKDSVNLKDISIKKIKDDILIEGYKDCINFFINP